MCISYRVSRRPHYCQPSLLIFYLLETTAIIEFLFYYTVISYTLQRRTIFRGICKRGRYHKKTPFARTIPDKERFIFRNSWELPCVLKQDRKLHRYWKTEVKNYKLTGKPEESHRSPEVSEKKRKPIPATAEPYFHWCEDTKKNITPDPRPTARLAPGLQEPEPNWQWQREKADCRKIPRKSGIVRDSSKDLQGKQLYPFSNFHSHYYPGGFPPQKQKA